MNKPGQQKLFDELADVKSRLENGKNATQSLIAVNKLIKTLKIELPEDLQIDLDKLIQINANHLGLETHVFGDSSVSVSPNRGLSIASLKLKGKEIFYSDEEKRKDPRLSLREGFRMFPQAGPLSPDVQEKNNYNMAQHGFGRNEKWTIDPDNSGDNYWAYKLKSNSNTKSQYPHKFVATQDITLHNDNVRLEITALNKGKESMKLAPGHHTYYKVAIEDKKDIRLDTRLGVNEEQMTKWLNGNTVKIDNPGHPFKVVIPGTGILELNFDSKFKKIRLRCEVDKPFVCIEPVVCNPGDFDTESDNIEPGGVEHYSVSIKLLD